MKLCTNCNSQITKEDVFCTECGTKVETAEKPENTQPQEALQWEAPPQEVPPSETPPWETPPWEAPPQSQPSEPTHPPVVTINKAAVMGSLESMKNRMGIGEPERNATDAYESNMKIVPDSIKATEGEIPIRQYNIAVLRNLLRFERSEGRLQITNKRIIFRAAGRSIGGRTTLQQEFSLNEIAGVEAIRTYRFSFFHLVCGLLVTLIFAAMGITIAMSGMDMGWGTPSVSEVLLMGIFVLVMILFEGGMGGMGFDFSILGLILGFGGLIGFVMIHKKFLLKLVLLGLSFGGFSVVMLTGTTVSALLVLISLASTIFGLALYCLRPDLELMIKNKGALEQSPPVRIRRSRGFWFFGQQDTIGFSEVMPTHETERAIREIGAIIDDIQTLGDLGIEKWVR
ncbi:MAG: zinc-ribbon domain-containing protein [Defluviitaleaceae bacterium]|nr:zinc-ribbon domain-containing protein [Defluviitaleaceae bacterium]